MAPVPDARHQNWVVNADKFVTNVDNLAMAAREIALLDPDSMQWKEGMASVEDKFKKVFKTQQLMEQQQITMTNLSTQPLYLLKDGEHVITLSGPRNWVCNTCNNASFTSPDWGHVMRHLTSQAHLKAVQNRQLKAASTVSVQMEARQGGNLAAISRNIRRNVAVAVAQHSLPFTAGTVMLDVLQKTMSTITDGHNSVPVAQISAAANKHNLPELARVGQIVNTLCRKATVNQHGEQFPLSVHRTTVATLVTEVGQEARAQMLNFFASCTFVGLIVDESAPLTQATDPVYVGMVGVDNNMRYLHVVIGQGDATGKKGDDFLCCVKDVVGNSDLWARVKAVGTDGCSAMRSHTRYAGKFGTCNMQSVSVNEKVFCDALGSHWT
jgi:hypothetical protein